jgi:hypothetical protein
VLEQELVRGELNLKVIRTQVARGPATAGNAGWPIARSPQVAFTGDDCLWLTAYFLVHDVVESWAVIRGAVRYRTLVL